MPAHLVAKNAYSIVDDIVWVEEDPCFAKQALIHDVNFMVPLLWKVYAFPIKKKKKSKIVILRAKSLVSGRIKTTNNKNKNLPICFYPTYQKLLLSWRGNPAHLLGEPNLAIYIQFLTDFVLVCLSLLLIVVSHCSPSATR